MSAERVVIGHLCEKGPHTALIGERDYGACGSHYYATIYIERDRTTSREASDEEFRENAEQAGRELAAQLNRLEDLEWAADGDDTPFEM